MRVFNWNFFWWCLTTIQVTLGECFTEFKIKKKNYFDNLVIDMRKDGGCKMQDAPSSVSITNSLKIENMNLNLFKESLFYFK